MSLIQPLPENTSQTLPLSLSIFYTSLNSLKRVICGQKDPHVLPYTPSLLFSIYRSHSEQFISFLYSSFLAFPFSMTHLFCISMPPIYHPLSCSPSASTSPLPIIHPGYNHSFISNNTSVAPRGKRGELC